MTESVRKQKSGDQLTVGDWLAPGELVGNQAAEVLYALAYPAGADRSRDNDGKHVQLVVREQGATVPYADVVAGNTLFDLASEDDLAALREQAERARQIADIRALADWLEANPWLPVADLDVNRHLYGLDGYRTVVELAERLGVELEKDLDDRTRLVFRKGPLTYTLLVWHKDGRPAEPADDPTGLQWARSDAPEDGELTQPGRVEPHTGGVTDGGLVDETPGEIGERVEVGADGCGCPVTEEVRANGSSIDGTERVEHRPKCWARPDIIPPADKVTFSPEQVIHVSHIGPSTECGLPVADLPPGHSVVSSWSEPSTCAACADEAPF